MRKFLLSRRRLPFVLLAMAVVLFAGQHFSWFKLAGVQLSASQPGLYKIDHFIDGDTIAVDMNGQVQTIRFVGVDTPETHKPNTPVQCFGPQAAAFTKATIGAQRVRLVSDPLSTDRDRYGRLLRYVYLPNGTLLDKLLIQKGYGFAYVYFPFSKSQQFLNDEKSAQSTKAGLWSSCHPTANDYGGYDSNALST